MKKLSILLPAALLLVATSCGKAKKITEEDAVDFMEYALNDSGDGVAKQAKDVAKDMDDVISLLPCGATKDTTVHFTMTGAASADYTFTRHYELVCGADTTITCSGSHEGYFESERVRIDNEGGRSWTLAGIAPSYANYTYDGSSAGGGVWKSKVRRKKTTTTSWNITTDNVVIEKGTRKIISGTGVFTLNAQVEGGDAYTFNGTITFNGGGLATIVINGNTYTINIY